MRTETVPQPGQETHVLCCLEVKMQGLERGLGASAVVL